MIIKEIRLFFLLLIAIVSGCGSSDFVESLETKTPINDTPIVEGVDYFLPNIDLNHWKVTLPFGNPSEVKPPEILNYASNSTLKEFMFNDSTDGSLVFYTHPGSTTANSSYSRTELREQLTPGSNNTNWTFSEGGTMEGELAVTEITKDNSGKDHRTIIMQIHGRLSNSQRDLIGENDNNAPPVLKIYWQEGRIRVLTKVLKNRNISDIEILKTDSWTDDEGFYFSENVGHSKFRLKVIASYGKLEIILNESESHIVQNIDLEKWDVFENYFKAGNYLQTKDHGSYSKVKYYSLEVIHE